MATADVIDRISRMNRQSHTAPKRPGRPSKFGRPSRVIAVTLPEDAIDRLRRVHRDLGWAIVKLLDGDSHRSIQRREETQPDVELVTIAERRSLIVVNREVIGTLPGVNIIPLYGNRAFLALDIDRGMSDLELSVMDRLAQPRIDHRERQALMHLRAKLTAWRRNHELQVHTRAIIVIERPMATARNRPATAARSLARKRASARRRTETAAEGVEEAELAGTTTSSAILLT